jgi:hypothetical protein
LINKQHSQWNSSALHEKVEVKAKLHLKHPIRHWVFENISDQVLTNDKYSTLGAQQLFEAGKKFSVAKMLLKPLSKFIETFFWKRGFKDGMAGFMISISAAYSVFLKFAKLWELENAHKKHSE